MNEITFEKCDSIYYRKYRLKACIQDILDSLGGRKIKIKPLVTDDDGSYQDEKLISLVRALMDCLSFYIRYQISYEAVPGRVHRFAFSDSITDAISRIDVIGPRRYNTIASFISCALKSLSRHDDSDLADLIALASGMTVYPSYKDLLSETFRRYYLERTDSITYDPVRTDQFEIYARDSAPFTSLPSGRHCIKYFTDHIRRPAEISRCGEIMRFRYDMGASGSEIEEMIEGFKSETVQVPEDWVTAYELEKRDFGDRLNPGGSSPSIERDLWVYLRTQQLVFSPEIFEDAVTGMIDVYSARHGSEAYSDPDRFYPVYDRIVRAGEISASKSQPREDS